VVAYELAHPEVAVGSARHYLANLEALRSGPGASAPAKDAASALIQTLETALIRGGATTPGAIAFGMGSLGAMSGSPELARFLNQQQLGVGWDGARIVAIGTEAADDPRNPGGVPWQALQAVLILAGSPTALVRPMVTGSQYWASCVDRGLPPEPWRPIHVHPNDFEQIQRRAVNHTWCNLARVVADESEGWRSLLDVGASPALGDLVYQIERSARGAKRSLDGHAPTDERTDWLVQEVLPELRKTARVLLLHGFGRGKGWNAATYDRCAPSSAYAAGSPGRQVD